MFTPVLRAGNVVLVTGGATGLGRSMCERILELGARVAVASRKLDVLEKAAAEMTAAHDGEVPAIAWDVRAPNAMKAMEDAVYERFGRLDVPLKNAAGIFISPTERFSPRAVGWLLHGTFYCTHGTSSAPIPSHFCAAPPQPHWLRSWGPSLPRSSFSNGGYGRPSALSLAPSWPCFSALNLRAPNVHKRSSDARSAICVAQHPV